MSSVIVIGASAAGIACVRALRSGEFNGVITLIDKDANGAYERPPLSKKVLMEPTTACADIALIDPQELSDLNVTVKFGSAVTKVDPATRTVELANGETFTAENIVICTGGEARRLPLPGADLANVFVLRHFADAEALRSRLADKSRVAVVGGGFIGAETVASLAQLGKQITWLDALPLPLAHLLPKQLSEKIVAHHLQQNVELITECKISEFTAQDDTVSVVLADGKQIEVDAIVLGVGMAPSVNFLPQDADMLSTQVGGILVNHAQATKFAGVYAAGDVAAIDDGEKVKRHEHWQSAQYQGECAAASILGNDAPEEPTDWFWSDQGDLHIEMAGKLPADAQLICREEGDWPVYFAMQGEHVIGAVSVNNSNAVRTAIRMIKNQVESDPAQLADPAIALRKLMRGKI